MPHKGTLYLIPSPLAHTPLTDTLPQGTLAIIPHLSHFVVEELRTARRYLSSAGLKGRIDDLKLFVLNEQTPQKEFDGMLLPLLEGYDMGLLSEAGLPAVADPGAALVALAHQKEIKVAPLCGPSSILLALMASGLNGQSFAFVGYLPIVSIQRKKSIKNIEQKVVQQGQTQIFMETPYRNIALFQDLLLVCADQTHLCLAANLTAANAFITTKTIRQWRTAPLPPIHKAPTIFLLGNFYLC